MRFTAVQHFADEEERVAASDVIVEVVDNDSTIEDGLKFVIEAARDVEKAKFHHVMHGAGCNVGDALVLMVQDKDFGNDSTAQDFANLLLGRVTLSADRVKSGYFGELQLEQAGCSVQAFIEAGVGRV